MHALNEMVEMGFKKEDALPALRMFANDVEHSMLYLVSKLVRIEFYYSTSSLTDILFNGNCRRKAMTTKIWTMLRGSQKKWP